MTIRIDYDVRGLPEAQKLLEQFQGGPLNNRMRRALRAGAKVFRVALRAEALRRTDLPRTFAKTRTRSHRYPLAVSVSPQSPLSTIFEHGAESHDEGGAGQLLANKGAGFIARGPVHHPGMLARPVIGPVFTASEDEAEDAVGDTLFEGIR